VKLLVHLAPRLGAEAATEGRLLELGRELAARAPDSVASVATMWRVPGDPFGAQTPTAGALEIRAGEGQGAAALASLAEGLAARFGDDVHSDLCTALVGEDHVFIAARHAPIRYQYLMRRRAGFTHESYLDRYREIHSRFGFATPGISGYVQLHVDVPATRAASRAAGFAGWDVDSVSELHMESLERFLEEIASSTIGADAMADEEVFVDRANSRAFCSKVEWHRVEDR
jgi:hypothetical protein